MDYVGVRRVTPDGEIVGEARLLGLFTTKAYAEPRVRDAGAAPQAAARARGRGPDRGLARLQGRGRAVRHVPEGRAVRRAGRRPAPRRRRAAGARGHRPRAPARPPRAGRPQRLVRSSSLPRDRYTRAAGRARDASCSCARFGTRRRRGPARARTRARACACTSSSTRRTGCPRSPARELEREVVAARAHVGRRAARRAGRALRRARPAAAGDLGRTLPDHYKGYTTPQPAAIDIALLRAAGRRTEPFVVSLQPLARATTRVALYKRGPKVELWRRDADARGPRAARDRGDLDAAGRRRRDVGAGVPRARAGRQPLDLDDARRPRGGADRRRATAATPRPTRSTGSSSPPGSTAARWRSCAPTASTASASARASPRATRTTCWWRTRRSPPSSCATSSCASTPTVETDEAAETRAARRDPRRPRRGRLARPRPHPAQPARRRSTRRCARTPTSDGRGALAFKLRSADVPAMPQPAPAFEIYVYSPDDGGHPPARRPDRPRRHPLVGPAWTTAPRSTA